MWIISVTCLLLVAALCAVGVFHKAFDDTLLQRIGMGMLCISCCGSAHRAWTHEYADAGWMLLHLSMAVYAVGTAIKTTVYRARELRWPVVAKFDEWVQSRTKPADFDSQPR